MGWESDDPPNGAEVSNVRAVTLPHSSKLKASTVLL